MNKKADVFIYITAILSFGLMIFLLTTSNSISYSLIDDYVNNSQKEEKPKLNKVKNVIAAFKPKEAEAENLEDRNLHSLDKTSETETADNEIDKLIVSILLDNNNETIPQSDDNVTKSEADEVLKIYENETPKPTKTVQLKHQKRIPTNIPAKKFHIVKKGEYLSTIAKAYEIPLKKILLMNSLRNPNRIQVGQKIYLDKNAALKNSHMKYITYRIRKNDTILKIARRHHASYHQILALNNLKNANRIWVGQKLKIPTYGSSKIGLLSFRWPLVGHHRISSPYGMRKDPFDHSKKEFHKGIDIPAPVGTHIHASTSGKVIFTGTKHGYGNVIILRHKKGYLTVYAHCSQILVKSGQFINSNQVIALVGNTGKSTGSHLHFEVRKFSRPLNPLTILSQK